MTTTGMFGSRPEHALAQVEAAHLGHAEVRQDDVEVLRRHELERALRGRRGRDLEAMADERHLEQVARLLLIVDDQDLTLHLEHLGFLVGSAVARRRDSLACLVPITAAPGHRAIGPGPSPSETIVHVATCHWRGEIAIAWAACIYRSG